MLQSLCISGYYSSRMYSWLSSTCSCQVSMPTCQHGLDLKLKRNCSAMQGFENTNGAQPSFEPFASSQDPWKAFPDPPAQAQEAPEGAGWADFEGAAPFQAAPSHGHTSGLS